MTLYLNIRSTLCVLYGTLTINTTVSHKRRTA